MKKALSIVLSVAMLMTVACSMFIMPVSAAADVEAGYLDIMNIDNVVEGAENVTVNEDGSWTITGKIGIAVNQTYDLDTVKYIYQDLDAATEVKIFFYDAVAGTGFGLYDNWVGPTYYPVGNYTGNDGISGIYSYNNYTVGEGNVATLTSVYIEFPETEANPCVTLNKLYLNDGTLMITPLTSGIFELMDLEYVTEGAENVTVNEDGSWTITGDIGMAINQTYDLDTMKYIYQDLEATTPMDIILYDGYANKWLHMYNNWKGPDYFPAGSTYAENNGIDGIYSYNNYAVGEGNVATLTSVRIEFDTTVANPSVTLNQLYLNDGTLKPAEVNLGELKNDYDTTIDLAVKDASAWSLTDPSKNGGANAVVSADETTLYVGTDRAGYPSVYMDYAEPITVDAKATIYADFTVDTASATTIYLFFNGSTANEFVDGQYVAIVADATNGHYSGYITLSDVVPAGCYNEDGTLSLTSVKIFGNDNAGANDASVTIKALDLCYTTPEEPAPIVSGDLNGNGVVEMREALKIYQAANGKSSLTAEQLVIADINGNGSVEMREALMIYRVANGLA